MASSLSLKILPAVVALLIAVVACNLPIPLAVTPLPTALALSTAQAGEPTTRPAPPLALPTPSPSQLLPTPAPTHIYQPVFEESACAFRVPGGTNPRCGYLVVPENRSAPGSSMIRLHVAVFPSRAENPAPDPVVYLSGGPGSAALDLAGYLFDFGIGMVLERSDLVLFDQRGTGSSQPRLDCPERQQLTGDLLAQGITAPSAGEQIRGAFRRCRERLAGEGIDLFAYTSAASAADVNDLRIALGYSQLNLYGVSYGTRLGLTVMRDFPSALRSAVLDSVYPPQENLYTSLAPNAERSFDVLFERCAADPICSAAYPDLRGVFFALVDQLNASPVPVALFTGGAERPVLLDGGLLIDVLFVGMYNPVVTRSMPEMIFAIRRGDYAILSERLALYFDPSPALGMQMSVQCGEEISFSRVEDAYHAAQNVQPQIAAFFPASVEPLFSACVDWNPNLPNPRENQLVSSDVPALLLSGEFDPITPPAWAQKTATGLKNAYFYEYPGNGHWVTRSSTCALQMALAFWQDPSRAPDASCLE